MSEGQLLYMDEWHLSSYGVQRLEGTLEKAMTVALKPGIPRS
jgi:hypothetical protein